MSKVETEFLIQSAFQPLVWKRYIDDIFSFLWIINRSRIEIAELIEQANNQQPTVKFTAEVSEMETTFQNTNISESERLKRDSVLDVRTHFEPTETFQYIHFISFHPQGG